MATPLREPNEGWPPGAPPTVRPRPRFTPQALFGLIVIIVGVLFTLDNLESDRRDRVSAVLAGGARRGGPAQVVARAGPDRVPSGGLFLVGLGSWMLLERIVAIQIRIHDLWPLFFVFLGGYMVWKGLRGTPVRQPAGQPRSPERARDPVGGRPAQLVPGVRRRRSDGDSRADARSICGRRRLSGEAVMDLFAFWGGIEIRVPEDWTIHSRVTPLMGGFEDKTHQVQPADSKRLVLRGFAIMGGIVIKN